jgi:hypothetical protein
LLLAEELGQRIREAEQEWEQIDRDLLKIVGTAAVGGLLAAGPLIAAGHAYFLEAAAGVAGLGPVINSTLQRRSVPDRFPAAFFMKVEEKEAYRPAGVSRRSFETVRKAFQLNVR